MGPFDPKWDKPALYLMIVSAIILLGSIALSIMGVPN